MSIVLIVQIVLAAFIVVSYIANKLLERRVEKLLRELDDLMICAKARDEKIEMKIEQIVNGGLPGLGEEIFNQMKFANLKELSGGGKFWVTPGTDDREVEG